MPVGKQMFIRRYAPTAEEVAHVESHAIHFLMEVDALFDQVAAMPHPFDES